MKEFLPKSAAKMADCLIKRYGLLTSRWSYDYGVAWRGMEALYAMTGEKKYFDYIKDAMDTFVTDESGAIRDYTLDEFNVRAHQQVQRFPAVKRHPAQRTEPLNGKLLDVLHTIPSFRLAAKAV